MAYGTGIENFFGPKPIYGEKTSKEGEFRQTGTQSVRHSFSAKGGAQTRNVQVPYYTWFPKAEAAPAPAPAAPNTPAPPPPPQTPVNDYQSQIDDINDRVNNTQSQKNTVDFEGILNSMQASFNQRLAEQAAAQSRYLNNLQIQQDTRLNQMAAEQKAAAEKLEVGQRTYQQNEARASQLGALQIAGSSETPRTGGTQGFKRRKLQINPVTANALEGILGGSKAATTTNTLNV